MPRERKNHIPTFRQVGQEGWHAKWSPLVGSRTLSQLLRITFPSTSSVSRQALVRSLFGPPATKSMVWSHAELEVTSKSTVRLSVTVELMLPFKRSRKAPLPAPSQFEGVNELLSTMLKLQQLQPESSSDGLGSTEEWANHVGHVPGN